MLILVLVGELFLYFWFSSRFVVKVGVVKFMFLKHVFFLFLEKIIYRTEVGIFISL